jgi:hypothetical protein
VFLFLLTTRFQCFNISMSHYIAVIEDRRM